MLVKNNQSSSDARYIFWAWHNNDIDHMVPIIYGLIKNGVKSKSIRYIALNPVGNIFPEYDKRLIFLRELGIVFELPHAQKTFHKFLYILLRNKVIYKYNNFILKLIKFLYDKYFGNNQLKWPNWKYALNVINGTLTDSVFIFDHNNSLLHKSIINEANKEKIVCISVPHGLVTFYEQPGGEEIKSSFDNIHSLNIYDLVIMPNQFSADRQRLLGLSSEKIVCLGSARFCPEWIEVISKIYPKPKEFMNKDSKIKVLFLMEKGEAGGRQISYVDEQIKTIEYLNDDCSTELIIKYNTRGISRGQKEALKAIDCLQFDNEYATPELISWADVIVAGGTSVIFDPLVRGKVVIIMGYIHPVTFVYPEYKSPAFTESFSEFVEYFKKIINNRHEEIYTDSSTDKLINDFVSAQSENVLKKYSTFLKDKANRSI